MDNEINSYVEHLQRRRESPDLAVIAATAIGRQGPLLRRELEEPPRVLGPGDADNALSALTLAMWDMRAVATQRAASAWALGEIGGPHAARKLLNRLEGVFVQRGPRVLSPMDRQDPNAETNAVCATLVEALARAIDPPTSRALSAFDRGQLGRIWQALKQDLLSTKDHDPDLTTAQAMALARLALRLPADLPRGALRDLLSASEPTASLAAIGILTDLLPAPERERVIGYLYDEMPAEAVSRALKRLGDERARPYSLDETQRLLQLAVQFWSAEEDTRQAGHVLRKRT
jgi:hypothetical protein